MERTAKGRCELTSLLCITLLLGGACLGSFTNVVAWRLPREESVLWPGSHCPKCGHPVRWHDNVPVLGWFLLQGRCRDCHQGIPSRYPLVEACSAILWLSAFWGRGLLASPDQPGLALLNLLAGIVLISVLLPLVLIDIDHLWLPEPLCRLGVVLGIVLTGALYLVIPWPAASSVLLNHLLAASAGLLVLEGLSALSERMLGQPALGLGDAKLAALAGAWLGLGGVWIALAIAVFSGAFVGTIGRLSGRLGPRQPFPFGPFIALGIWLTWLVGSEWWLNQWMKWFGVF